MPLDSKTSYKTSGLIYKLIAAGAIATICSSFAIIPLIRNKGFGSRGTRKVYTFYHKERVEAIIGDDIIWGKDRYTFLLNNKKKGTLISDHGSIITISGGKNPNYGFKWETVLPNNTTQISKSK